MQSALVKVKPTCVIDLATRNLLGQTVAQVEVVVNRLGGVCAWARVGGSTSPAGA